jgi:sulfur-oxidizing protein SoxA
MVRRRRGLRGLCRNHGDQGGRRAPVARPWGAQRLFLLLVICLSAGSGAGLTWAQGWDTARYEVDGRRSGYLYLGEQTRALQDDDFLNSGIFAVERGEEIWNAERAHPGPSCASCHGDAATSMRGVAARYPQYDSERGGIVNLELRINEWHSKYTEAAPLPYESEDLLALTAYVTFQSRGVPMKVDVSGEAQTFFEKGRAFYFRRRGQLDLACSQCHDDLAGQRLRADPISQGQINGFPFYRLRWRSMGSRHRMFGWCNLAVRAEPYELGSEEYLNLELYVAWRGRGLPMEAPAVRP